MNVAWEPLSLPGCFRAHLPAFGDARGGFLKLYRDDAFAEALPDFVPREAYLTTSARGVLRGMHFQLPPHDHAKVVICLAGAARDVIVDLRQGDGLGRTAAVELTPEGINCVALPIGVGHGFLSREDGTQLLYLVGTAHAPEADRGVAWDSIDADWGLAEAGIDAPILSDRDRAHPPLRDFVPPRWRRT